MNTTYIIGNGFDVNLGLKTKYSDFYDYYRNQPSPSKEVKQLKENIDRNKENWSDLELALGKYTTNFKDSNSAIETMEDLCDHLTEYLKLQSLLIPQSNEKIKEEMLRCLANPYEFFLPADQEQIRSYYSNRLPAHGKITILSLNYTPSIEHILDYMDNQPISIDSNDSWLGYGTEVHPVLHPHHTLDDIILVGLNDESQIANQALCNNEAFKENFIKPACNKMLSSGIENQCSDVINNSDLFVVFGSSLGATDKLWWQKIANRMVNSNSLLLLFIYDHKMKRTCRRLGEQKRTVINNFVSHLEGYTDTQIEDIKRKTLVSFNSEIFGQLKDLSSILYIEHGIIVIQLANTLPRVYRIGNKNHRFGMLWSAVNHNTIRAVGPDTTVIALIKDPQEITYRAIENGKISPTHSIMAKVGDAIVWRNENGYRAITKIKSINVSSTEDTIDSFEIEYFLLKSPLGESIDQSTIQQ